MTPLVFVHGFMGGSEQWGPQAPLAQGRDLICLDLPGFGKNADMPVIDRIDGFAQWALDELTRRGVHRFDLMGHSMGGMVVQDMVRLAPERVDRLVLYGTGAVGVLPGRFEPIEVSMQRARQDGPHATARRISATWFLDLEEAEAYPDCAAIAVKSGLEAIIAGLDAMRNWSGKENLGEIGCPTLVIWGDRDRTYPWSQTETLWRGIGGASLAVVPGAAHAVHLERPALFNILVDDFLKQA